MIVVDYKKCIRCGGCVAVCPVDALELNNEINCSDKCTNCTACIKFCPVGALKIEG